MHEKEVIVLTTLIQVGNCALNLENVAYVNFEG